MMISVKWSYLVIVKARGFEADNFLVVLIGIFESPFGNGFHYFHMLMAVNPMMFNK